MKKGSFENPLSTRVERAPQRHWKTSHPTAEPGTLDSVGIYSGTSSCSPLPLEEWKTERVKLHQPVRPEQRIPFPDITLGAVKEHKNCIPAKEYMNQEEVIAILSPLGK